MNSSLQPPIEDGSGAAQILPLVTGLRVAPTGISEVDAAAAHLVGLVDADVHEHPAIYDEVHQGLTAALDVAMSDSPA